MTGTKGKSGGRRRGAGRTTVKATVRAGDEYSASWTTPDGVVDTLQYGPLQVVEVARRRIVLRWGDNLFTLIK